MPDFISPNPSNVFGEIYSKTVVDGDITYGCIFCGCDTNYECKMTYDCGFAGEPVKDKQTTKSRVFKIVSICRRSVDYDLGI